MTNKKPEIERKEDFERFAQILTEYHASINLTPKKVRDLRNVKKNEYYERVIKILEDRSDELRDATANNIAKKVMHAKEHWPNVSKEDKRMYQEFEKALMDSGYDIGKLLIEAQSEEGGRE